MASGARKNLKKYNQNYKTEWINDPALKDWISPHPTDRTKTICKYCKATLQSHKKDLLQHARSKKHEKCVEEKSATQDIIKFCGKNEQRKITDVRLSIFIAEHCSILTINHLSELLRSLDPTSTVFSNLKLHRTKCTMLLKNVIGSCIVNEIVKDIGDFYFSLIIDESTDISSTKTLCLIIKYPSIREKKIITTFYRIIEVTKADAQSLYESIVQQLNTDKINIKKLIGIGVDGASTMIGAHTSLSALLKTDVPDLITVKCVCHSLHLCAEYACRMLPDRLEFLIREIHNYFSHSSKRILEYKDLFQTLERRIPSRVPKLSGTRWLAREAAVKIILEQYEAFQNFFYKSAKEDKCFTAEQILGIMRCPAYKAFLIFLKNHLYPISRTNRLFQSNDINPLKIFEDLMLLYKSFLRELVVPSQLEKINEEKLINFEFQNYLMHEDSIYFGYEFEEVVNTLSSPEKSDVKLRCRSFLTEFVIQLQKRLPQNLEILQKITIFSPSIATSQNKPSIVDVAKTLKKFSFDECEKEWQQLSFTNWVNTESDIKFWMEVHDSVDSGGNPRYKNISFMALSLYSLPISNASVEHAFSVYNVVKSKIRNRLSLDIIQSILAVRHWLKNKELNCTSFMPPEEMKKFDVNMYDHVRNEQEIEVDNILEDISQDMLEE